jgi:adenosylmethionine-8-amino-7-oxononanoate aminotransferase
MSSSLGLNSAQQSYALKESKTTEYSSIFHWSLSHPPTALAAEGIYIDLEDGRRVIDGVGGTAVACLGNSHPTVTQAIKNQADKLSCTDRSILTLT